MRRLPTAAAATALLLAAGTLASAASLPAPGAAAAGTAGAPLAPRPEPLPPPVPPAAALPVGSPAPALAPGTGLPATTAPPPAPPRGRAGLGPAPPVPAGASPAPAAATTPDPAYTPLRRHLERLLVAAGLREGTAVALAVRDGRGRPVALIDADRPLLPASTQKLVTAAATLQWLGDHHRFVTAAAGTGALDAEGVLHGDLVLVGSGDPALATPRFMRRYPERPATPLAALADRLVEIGLRAVAGSVVGDTSLFGTDPVPPGWKPDYLSQLAGRRVTALAVDAGLDLTDPAGAVAAADPAGRAAAELTALLAERGVMVSAAPAVVRAPLRTGPDLAVVQSPPLRELLRHTVRHSDNHMADMLFRTLGAADGGDGGWEAGGAAARSALRALGVDVGGAVLADGSGLSRDGRLSAALLVELDATLSASPLALRWRDAMAVTGRRGTLRGWLDGTVAAARFAGKTGTLDDVRTVAGSARGPGGRLHAALLVNGLHPADAGRADVLMRAVVLALAAHVHGCDLPVLEPTGRRGAPPRLVAGACPHLDPDGRGGFRAGA